MRRKYIPFSLCGTHQIKNYVREGQRTEGCSVSKFSESTHRTNNGDHCDWFICASESAHGSYILLFGRVLTPFNPRPEGGKKEREIMNNTEVKEMMWKKKNALKLKRASATKEEKAKIDAEISKCNSVLSHIETRTSARLHTTSIF